MRITRFMSTALLALGALWHLPCSATEFVIREAGLTFQLPASWQAKVEEKRVPSGQLMQRWVREPLKAGDNMAMPGMVAIATPVPADTNLLSTSQLVIAREPYGKKLGVDTTCAKCMQYTLRMPTGTASTIAPDDVSACESLLKSGQTSACSSEAINTIGLKIEPSWSHRFVKTTPAGAMKITLIHALVNGKFVDISFWYPPETASQIEGEIAEIVSTLKVAK